MAENKPTIFITGASGFVGRWLCRDFAKTSRVLALSRSASSDDVVSRAGAEPLRGDLHNLPNLDGVDTVIHSAGYVSDWGPKEEFYSVNVEGTQQVLQTARAGGVKKFLFLSSESVLLEKKDLVQLTEDTPYPDSSPFHYAETKKQAEMAVLAANRPDFQTYAVRPKMIWGCGDNTFVPKIQQMVTKGRFVWVDRGAHQISTTYIKNLLHGIHLVLTKGKGGEAYFIADEEQQPIRSFLTQMMQVHGVTLPEKSLPGPLVRSAAEGVSGLWKILRLPGSPPLTPLAAQFMSREGTVSIEKAKSELGYHPPFTFSQALQDLQQDLEG